MANETCVSPPPRQEVNITYTDGKEFGPFKVDKKRITGGEWRPYTGERYRESWAGEYITEVEEVKPDGSKMVLRTIYKLARNSPLAHVFYLYEDFDPEGKLQFRTPPMPSEQPVIHFAYLRKIEDQSSGEVGHNLSLFTLYRAPAATHPYPLKPSAEASQ